MQSKCRLNIKDIKTTETINMTRARYNLKSMLKSLIASDILIFMVI